jgi:hypothetical protein
MQVGVAEVEMVLLTLPELVGQGVVVTQVQRQTVRLAQLILEVAAVGLGLLHLLAAQAAPVS